jgi:antitoxin component YwqK of YwqJK toxin-antitoxin module
MMPISEDDLKLNEEGRLCLASGESFTGVTEDCYEDGQPASRGHFLDGLRHGHQQEWYGTGQIRSEETVCLGQTHGYRREWYPNGQLKYEGLSEHGFRVSVKRWSEDGILVHESQCPYPDQKYESLLLWRAEARALGFGRPEGVDVNLLPP